MTLPTKDTFTYDWTAQADYPNWTPLQTKQNLNARDEELRVAHNDIVTKLNATTSGSSGADNVGATPPTGLTVSANTTQGVLNALKTTVDNVVLGQIPDGSLTDVKLSNASTEIKQRFKDHEILFWMGV